MGSEDKFCLTVCEGYFAQCLEGQEDDVLMDPYLNGYKELNKFFQLLGKVFGFVSSDVKSKVEILEELKTKEGKENFKSFQKMIAYEKDSGLLEKKDYVSGCRTLLRLHRGLDFIREFLRQLGTLSPDDKTGTCCQNAYNATLANFHPWLIRKGVSVAVYGLPTRDQLLDRVCKDKQAAVEALPRTLEILKQVYDRTQSMYTAHDLHGLP
ncbi:ceramide-1-phosphate transfer protein [Phlebotomus papatasi]|uniref:ceramide-1-phosphate transfer protein n=1 Tax=Phlebotomus papatasi TaxID=29031 RepID=UPI002484683C|nr:ceramide-1-phosphate transfer protein [Phlebotomus papatasi]